MGGGKERQRKTGVFTGQDEEPECARTDARTDARGRRGVHTHKGALFILKKEEKPAICDSTDGPAGHYVKQSESETHTADLTSLGGQRQTSPSSRAGRGEGATVTGILCPGVPRGDHSKRDCVGCRDTGTRQTLSVLATDTEEGKRRVPPRRDRRVHRWDHGIISQYMHAPNLHVVLLKYIMFVFVSYAPVKLGRRGAGSQDGARRQGGLARRKAPAEGRWGGGPHPAQPLPCKQRS